MTAFEPVPERRPIPDFTCSPPYHRLDCVGANCDDAETRNASTRAWIEVAEDMWELLGRALAPSAGLSNQELKEEIRTAMFRFEALRFPAGDR